VEPRRPEVAFHRHHRLLYAARTRSTASDRGETFSCRSGETEMARSSTRIYDRVLFLCDRIDTPESIFNSLSQESKRNSLLVVTGEGETERRGIKACEALECVWLHRAAMHAYIMAAARRFGWARALLCGELPAWIISCLLSL
jgi:hypothetical protein